MRPDESRKVMISLKNIVKEYRLGQIGYGTLNQDLQSWWARLRRKPDPNARIETARHLEGDILRALNGIDLTVYQGECVGIIGGNGAGKSTLLKLISRVCSPTSGSIDLYGRVTSMLEVGTGFHGEMTGRENIYLNGAILGMDRSEIDSKLEQIIDFSEVRDFIDTPVKRYSSGMYVKLAFSVASHLDSEIVIMDEVLAVGDAAFQKKCIEKMRAAAKDENRTVLYVSHNMNTVRELCDRCIVLADGKKLFDGDVEEAISRYNGYLVSANTHGGKRLDRIERRDHNLSGACIISELELVQEAVPEDGALKFRLKLHAGAELENVCLRVLVSNGLGNLVGMTYSDPFRVREGDSWLSFTLPVRPLAAGGYAADFVLLSFSGDAQIRHDFLKRVMSFSVEQSELYFGRKWELKHWGSVRLSRISVGSGE